MDSEQNVDSSKRRKPGIIYLSTIPATFNVMKIKSYFSEFGELGRVFLQTDNNDKKKNNPKKGQHYTEGWIEFKSKRKAKWVTLMLNGHQVGGKKKDPCYDELWNIKYLPRFKWAFLNQRLEYERESYRQRMGAAVSQVHQEADHFIKVSDISEKKKKEKKKKKLKMDKKEGDSVNETVDNNAENTTVHKEKEEAVKSGFLFKQNNTEGEILKHQVKKRKNEEIKNRIAAKKKRKEEKKIEKMKSKEPEEDFLGSIFVGSSK